MLAQDGPVIQKLKHIGAATTVILDASDMGSAMIKTDLKKLLSTPYQINQML